MRKSFAESMLAIAKTVAEQSTCSSRMKVGAVLVSPHQRILSTGYNGAPRGMPHCDDVGCAFDSDGSCIRAIHAEENTILQCAMHMGGTIDATLYTLYAPCAKCAKRIVQVKIARVVYVHSYKSMEGLAILRQAGVNVTQINEGENSEDPDILQPLLI